jgi:uncharacterized DUF497 family protein
MKIGYDPEKFQRTLTDRKIDFNDAISVFDGPNYELEDTRKEYGEKRIICYGLLEGRLVVVGYVQRGDVRHIFSMRKANDREEAKYTHRLG